MLKNSFYWSDPVINDGRYVEFGYMIRCDNLRSLKGLYETSVTPAFVKVVTTCLRRHYPVCLSHQAMASHQHHVAIMYKHAFITRKYSLMNITLTILLLFEENSAR